MWWTLFTRLTKAKNVFVIGGNSLVGPLLDADLFDHLIIQIAPLILGKGVPLFTQEEGQRFYQLDSLRQFGPFAELVFSRKKSEIEKGVDRMIKIYDTMSRDLREFVPIEEGKVRMYVCGPTVYNYIHVGNARSTVAFDTIRRYFEYRGYEVNYISNFTDVDDKIINRAKEEGISPQEVADKYIAAFREDVTALGVKPATRHPRVVEFMDDIIRFVADLIEKRLCLREPRGCLFPCGKIPQLC